MKLVADSYGRLTAAELFRPGAAYDATRLADGKIMVVELVEKPLPVVKIVRRGKRRLLTSDQSISNEDVQKAMEVFP